MSLYPDSQYPISPDIDAIHTKQFGGLGAPGTWGSGKQRLAVINEARQAGYDAGVMEAPDEPGAQPQVKLSEVLRRVVRQLAVAPKECNQAFYDQAIDDGMTDAEYVEIVGLLARATCFDVFARGIGVPLRPLPEPTPGPPTYQRPDTAVVEKAWVATIPNGAQGGSIGKELYSSWQPYIMRGVSLVPDEFRAHAELEEIQYQPAAKIMDWTYQHHDGLTRPQVEAVASRVSALNECFY